MVDGLVTARLALRPVTADDVDDLVALDSDPEVMRFITGGRAPEREAVAAAVARSRGLQWMASARNGGGEQVGWFALDPDADGGYELGYRLGHRWWGRGLATEGANALIDAAFSELGARRVWAQTMAVNSRSRRVMERCGLSYVRTFHVHWDHPIEGAEQGEVEYELLRLDWQGG